ncbi:hypothetical protein [Nocardioides marmoraquaticus]
MTPIGAWFAALLLCMGGGLVLATSWFVDWPPAVLIGASVAFVVGSAAFGVLAHLDARHEGLSWLRAVRRGLSTAIRAFVSLLP